MKERERGAFYTRIFIHITLSLLSPEGTACHVTVPTQPAASYSECILKINTPLKINVVSACTGDPVMTIPYDKLRRFGCQIAVGSDIVWFETCSCHGDMEEFQFFVVAMGIEKAYQIVQEYKRSVELALRDHLIMEEGDQSQFLYSYVVKSHYGHTDYPTIGRERILQSGLMSLSTSGGALSLSDLNKFARSRPSVPTLNTQGPIPGDMGKMSTPNALGGLKSISPSPSPIHSPRSPTSPNRMSLEQLQRSPRPSRSSQSNTSGEFDSGVNMETLDPSRIMDPSRHSAPCYFPALGSSPKQRKATLEDMRKGKSFDERPSPPTGKKITLKDFRATSVADTKSRKTSLADLQVRGAGAYYNRSPQAPRKNGYDSAVGSSSDLVNSPPYSAGSTGSRGFSSPYDHLDGGSPNGRHGLAAYAHLEGKDLGMSLPTRGARGKRSGPAYVET